MDEKFMTDISETIDTKVALLQRDLLHFGDNMKELREGQKQMQASLEKMTEKLETAYVTKAEFFTFQTEQFNPVKKKVDNLVWNLGLLVGGGGTVVTLVNWYLIYRK